MEMRAMIQTMMTSIMLIYKLLKMTNSTLDVLYLLIPEMNTNQQGNIGSMGSIGNGYGPEGIDSEIATKIKEEEERIQEQLRLKSVNLYFISERRV